jgi:hypothetical protein
MAGALIQINISIKNLPSPLQQVFWILLAISSEKDTPKSQMLLWT